MTQPTFASLAWDGKGKVTRRERFLAEMDAVIPWAPLLALIAPHYPKAGHGTQPMPLARMLRIYFVQQWFNLSDPAMEDALYDSEAMRRFVGIELGGDPVPDESTILRFRHLLERHQLTEAMFAGGEHAFHVVKRLWGFTTVRYRGLAKNSVRLFAAFALANLYLLRRRLAPEVCRA